MIHPIATDTRHTAVVRFIDAERRNQEARFADWTSRGAVTKAYRFIKRKIEHGDALCYRILHNPESLI